MSWTYENFRKEQEEWEQFKRDHPLPEKGEREYVRTRFGVYSLSDPDSGEVRYIGFTKDPMRIRNRHERSGRKGQPRLREWQKSLRQQGKFPVYELLGIYDTEDEARQRESREIERREGLLNVVGNSNFT